MEELSNPLIQSQLEAAENDDFSLIDGSSLDDLLDSMSETSFVDSEVNIIDEGVSNVEKPEAGIHKKNGEYNPRKSLAWDSAFNCAGFLDAEELSSIIEGSNSGRRQMKHLPGIQEDISKSTDSLSTMESDNLTLESLEADLFCDIRASIQRTDESSKLRKLNSNRGPEGTDSRSLSGTKSTSLHGNMVKQKSVSRKLIPSIQGDARLMKLGPVREQVGKPGGSRREPEASLSKLPAASDRKNLRAMTATKLPSKRMSIATGCKNSSPNNVGNTMAAGSGTKVSKGPRPGDSYSTIPKAALSAKSLSHSSTSRIGTFSTRSSFDSTTSSSVSSRILPLNGVQGKFDGAVSISPSSLRTRLPSRVPLKGTIETRTSRTSAHMSTLKHSPSSSPTSSISEWSSSSSVATVNQEHYVSKDCSNMHNTASLESISSHDFRVHPIEQTSKDQKHEVTGVPNISAHKLLADNGSKSNPISAKPTGLRMPSPKIGFFDGVKAGGKTPKAASMPSGSGLQTSRFVRSATGSSSPSAAPNRGKVGHVAVKATAITAGNSSSSTPRSSSSITPRSNARLAPTGRVDDKSTAPMKASSGTNIENVPAKSPKIKGQDNNAAAKISDGGKRFSESGSSSRKKSGLISLKKNASLEGMRHLKGNQVSGVAEVDHHFSEICNDSKVLDVQLLHGLIKGDMTDTELELVNIPKELDSTSIVDEENANIVAKSGGNEAGQACIVTTDQQIVSAEQRENELSGNVEAVGNKTELCEDMRGNCEPQNVVNFANRDTQLLHGFNNGETTDTELDLVNVSKEVHSTSNYDDENTVARGGNEATIERHDQVCSGITDQQNVSVEELENRLSGHVEVVGNETELCHDMNGNSEPLSAVNDASSDTQSLHGFINVETTGTELDLVIVSKEVDSTFIVDDGNVTAVAKRGGNEATIEKHDQQNVGAEQMKNGLSGHLEAVGKETELCEDMNGNFELQSIVNCSSSDTQSLHGVINVEVDSAFIVDENVAAVANRGGNEATYGKYDRVCGVIPDQQNVGAEQMENRLSGHLEAVGNETRLCEDLNGNSEPRSNVNCASSDTQSLHGLTNGDTADTKLDLVNLSKEVESTFNADDENTVAVAKSGGNETTIEKYDQVCAVITDQLENGLSGHVDAVGNKAELCEDMDWYFEHQSTVNLNSESHLPVVSSCAVELLGFNREEAADLSSEHTELSAPSTVPESSPGPRTPLADKNSLSDAYPMEALLRNFTSLTLNNVQR